MKQALALYHLAFEDLGSFASVLREEGYEITYRSAVHDLPAIDPRSADPTVTEARAADPCCVSIRFM
ncbi:MAG: hypothetical protein WDN31_13120 [Hyphomicrobium sp.]